MRGCHRPATDSARPQFPDRIFPFQCITCFRKDADGRAGARAVVRWTVAFAFALRRQLRAGREPHLPELAGVLFPEEQRFVESAKNRPMRCLQVGERAMPVPHPVAHSACGGLLFDPAKQLNFSGLRSCVGVSS